MRYKITIEYDGTNTLGWQKQLDGPSIQEYLEKAIHGFSQQEVEIYGAGRTDAGVHALAAVAHFDLETPLDSFRLREAINAHLRNLNAPVVVLDVEETTDDFHARFSATGRGYIYKILNRRAPSVLQKNRVWWVPYPLDVERMRQGAKHLIGKHDFSSFRAAACQANSPIRSLDKIEINTYPCHCEEPHKGDAAIHSSFSPQEIHFIFEAPSFLHHQVRNIVGTLKMVGDGTLNPDDVKRILDLKDRTEAGITAPASGLYLSKVVY